MFSCGDNNDASIPYEDRQEILDLISKYAYTFDEDRIEDFVQLFAEDAKTYIYFAGSDTPFAETSSNVERRIDIQEVRSSPINQPGMPRHFQTNTLLQRISPDRISGRTMVVCTQQPYDGSEARILFSGVYEDEFVYSGGRWMFASRRGLLDAPSVPGADG
jgi:hypothetical protein